MSDGVEARTQYLG
ncbi:unnamed protein product, partial [Didymodactylos carnosus]